MPLQWFDDIDDLGKHIGGGADGLVPPQAAKIIAEYGEAALKARIQALIYDSYTPKTGAWVGGTTYQRRYDLVNNVTSKIEQDGTILITTNAHIHGPIVRGAMFNDHGDPGGSFLKLLESDNLGIWKSGFPRPVVPIAQKDVESSAFWNMVNSQISRMSK